MLRIVFLLFILFGYVLEGSSQDSQDIDNSMDSTSEDSSEQEIIVNNSAEDETEKSQDDLKPDDSFDIDSQVYEEAEDIFVPSEEIPADEPIQFPTNI